MKVEVQIPDGSLVQGAICRLTIPSTFAGIPVGQWFDKSATTGSTGIAELPNPGILAATAVANLKVSATLGGREYLYLASIPTGVLGNLPAEHLAILSSQKVPSTDNPFVAVTDNLKWLVIGLVAIAGLQVVRNLGVKRYSV